MSKTLYQSVKFKRDRRSAWEKGLKQVNQEGIIILDSNKNIVEKIYKIEVCWI